MRHSAGGQDDAGAAVLHQFLRARQAGSIEAADHVGRRTRLHGRVPHDRRRLATAAQRRGMRADHDRVAPLERDQDLVNRGGSRIGRRQDRRHHAHRHGDFDDALRSVFAHHADGLQRPDGFVHALRRKKVLQDLVLDHAIGGLFHRQARQLFRIGGGRGRHRVHDAVHLLLGEILEFEECLVGALDQFARFGDGAFVFRPARASEL